MSNFLKRKIKKDEQKFKRKSVKVNDLKLPLSFIWFYPDVFMEKKLFIFPKKKIQELSFKEIIFLNAAIKKLKMPKMMAGYLVNKKKEPKNKSLKKDKVLMIFQKIFREAKI